MQLRQFKSLKDHTLRKLKIFYSIILKGSTIIVKNEWFNSLQLFNKVK